MGEAHRLQQIALARQQALGGTASATDALVDAWFDRAWLARSWQRCLAQGQRPAESVAFATVSAAVQRDTRDAAQALLAAAQPEMERLARAVAPIRYFAILTDAHGTVVGTAGAIDRSDRATDAIARVGVDLSERSVGTSAIGAALTELQPVWLHRGEHFFEDTAVYSCAGAPLIGPRGDCVGMLDLTGVNVAERPELKHLVAQSARQIEDALVLAVPHALCLRLAWYDGIATSERAAVMCLDADGAVVSANAAARDMLPSLHGSRHPAVHADELFALPWPQLFDLAQRGSAVPVPLWSGLRVSVRASRASACGDSGADAAALPLRSLTDDLIAQAVRAAGGNVTEAAQALGVSRATVYRRLGQGRRPGVGAV
ncbi:helix-turn-helix domain-containing protein [Ottowia flava]|uniref:Helix-turn-helix domain-containing protein n=1 Tax=Ottowia flava TaxID=2675430 RepID=A0ABW4KVF8_9BURK|nr:helix-turn-helix domain-containing protein [Ottowia sp. GY511]